jgi:hypothetical protein
MISIPTIPVFLAGKYIGVKLTRGEFGFISVLQENG